MQKRNIGVQVGQWTKNQMPILYTALKIIGDGRYIVDAQNNAYGATRVAVENQSCTSASEFNDLKKLKRDIENKNILWLYTGACHCIGLVTFDEL